VLRLGMKERRREKEKGKEKRKGEESESLILVATFGQQINNKI